jgi:hypothetical protein
MITDQERWAAQLLAACIFLPGSYDKRFVRALAAVTDDQQATLSPKQRTLLWKQVIRYRRQLPDSLVALARKESERSNMNESDWISSSDPQAMLTWLNTPQSCNGRPWSEWCPTERKLRFFADACRHEFYHGNLIRCGIWSGWESNDHMQSRMREEQLQPEKAAKLWVSEASQTEFKAAILRDIFGNPWHPDILPREFSLAQKVAMVCLKPEPEIQGNCPWLTEEVKALAESIYQERERWSCIKCGTVDESKVYDAEGGGHGHRGCWKEVKKISNGFLDPAAMAVLADMLQEHGCEEESLLRHLRGQEACYSHDTAKACDICRDNIWIPLRGPHCKGCWVLDLLTGRS